MKIFEEIVIEILARLPAKSLVRSMAVCRLWKSIITGPQFRLDSKRPSKELLLTYGECYCVVEDDNLLMLEADLPLKHYTYDRAQLIGSDSGLLCIGISMENRYFHRLIVWNPCIRKHVVIPDHPTDEHDEIIYAHGFGATSSGSDYKYVRIEGFRRSVANIKPMEIYSLKTGTWRRKYLDWGCYRSTYFSCVPVVLRGRLHWICRDWSIDSSFIFTFDLEDEVVEHIMLPECLSILSCGILPRVVMIKESLGLIAYEEVQRSTVWVMEEYGDVHSWIKLCNIDLSMGKIPSFSFFHLLKNGELLLDLGTVEIGGEQPLKLVTYNPNTGKTRDFGGLSSSSSSKFCGLINYYKESLVLLGNDHHAVADHKVLSISQQTTSGLN